MMNPAELENIARAEKDFWWYRGMRRILFRVLEPHLDGRRIRTVLEAGCGTGYFASVLEAKYPWRVVALDLGREGLERGRGMGLKRLCQANLAALPFADAAFELVSSLDVIVHFPRGEEGGAVRELARVLAPGGLLVLRVAALEALRSRHSQFACERQRFTRRRLRELAAGCGIRVLRCTYANSFLVPAALAKFRLWEPLLRKPPASGVTPVPSWLDGLLHFPLAAEAAWLGTGRNLPLGQSLILIGEKAPK